MRLLAALVHLVVALAFITVAIAPARPVGFAPMSPPQHHHAHHAATAGTEHLADIRNTASNSGPIHDRDGCQTACCLAPAQPPVRLPDIGAAEFFCAVRYVIAPHFGSSWAYAPDPEIPKRLS